jgi:nudix-type nucleoside diphosphatase (YffH/AdpP family)
MPVRIEKTETIYKGYSTLMRAELSGPDGGTFVREIEHHGVAVAVLPYDAERRCALLVSLPRAPVIWLGGPDELIEAPAGMCDDDHPDDAARREALEEVGVRLGDLEDLGQVYSCPGVSTERIGLYLAAYRAADRIEAGGGVEGEQENITVLEPSLAELWSWIDAGKLEDLKTRALVYALRIRRPELFEAK